MTLTLTFKTVFRSHQSWYHVEDTSVGIVEFFIIYKKLYLISRLKYAYILSMYIKSGKSRQLFKNIFIVSLILMCMYFCWYSHIKMWVRVFSPIPNKFWLNLEHPFDIFFSHPLYVRQIHKHRISIQDKKKSRSLEIRGLCSTKCSRETIQNSVYHKYR